MSHIPFLEELVVVAGLAVLVALVLGRLRLPTITGLLIAGVVAGPHGLGLVQEREPIEVLAEVGVVLLLFGIGLELSLSRLRRIVRYLLVGGVIQVGGSFAVGLALGLAFGRDVASAFVLGCLFALSSTAIVLRLLGERRELDAPHGRFIVGVLIFQDLCVVPMVLLIPLLGGEADPLTRALDVGAALAKAAAVVVGVLVVARLVVPRALRWVAASRSRELFLLAVLTLCIGTAFLTSLVGLSLALGAFLGGVAVADTTYGHRALADVVPLRNAFMSLFFISLGMLLDPEIVMRRPLEVALLFGGFLGIKALFATVGALAMRFPARVAWLCAVGLAQFGEFGFVILRVAETHGLVAPEDSRAVIAAGILSMSVTPLLVGWAPRLTAGERLLAPVARLLTTGSLEDYPEVEDGLRDHAVVIGYGVSGQLMGQALSATGHRWVALELDADRVREAQARGRPVYYADATSPEALAHAGIEHAVVVAVMVDDPSAVPRILAAVEHQGPEATVLVRTHYLSRRDDLLRLGADEVVVEEVESGTEILARALRHLGVPPRVVRERLASVRRQTLRSARPPMPAAAALGRLRVDSVPLDEDSPAEGHSLVDLQLRRATGAVVFAIEREDELLQDDLADMALRPGDVLHLAGTEAALDAATEVLTGAPEATPPRRADLEASRRPLGD